MRKERKYRIDLWRYLSKESVVGALLRPSSLVLSIEVLVLEAGGRKPHARAAVRKKRKAERKGNDARPGRSS